MKENKQVSLAIYIVSLIVMAVIVVLIMMVIARKTWNSKIGSVADNQKNNMEQNLEIQKDKTNKELSDAEITNLALATYKKYLNLEIYQDSDVGPMPYILEVLGLEKSEDIEKLLKEKGHDNHTYIKSKTKYQDFKNEMLKFMTEEIFNKKYSNYKNIDGYVAFCDVAIGVPPTSIENIKLISKSDNIYVFKITLKDEELYEHYLNGEEIKEQEYLIEIEEYFEYVNGYMVVSSKVDEDVENQTKIDWEEYPNDIDNKVNEWLGGIDLSSEVGEVSYNLMKKTIYSLSKQKEEIFNKMYFNGDSTEIVDKDSNYSRYCYPDNENNDLSAKYTKKIEYQIAIFNELYYEGYYDLDTLTKMQYEDLVQKKDFKHYTNVPKNLYYEINKLLIMNGNNESEKEYKNNGRAKKIKLTINDDKQYIFDLKDTNKVQIFDIDYRQNTIETPVKIDIEVLDKYNGEKTNDVYISDIQFGITSNIPQGR